MKSFPLSRKEVQFDLPELRAFYAGKRVLITGAAGSVGSALAFRLAELGCAHIAMLDQFDHGLIEVVDGVRRISPSAQITEALCDIRDEARLAVWMRRVAPDVVFHSAALKHVHLGERHPVECVITNLIGVRNVVEAAAAAGVSHFMLVSTDKAAAPVCVMGATKRLAELYLMGFAQENETPMQLKSVRFGNVWASQGSVLPRFAAQIEAGGPVEVTHPDMKRFFMTANEAVGLILSVAALDQPGAEGAYFMEMGDQKSIIDIARDMLARAGREDIEIKITGLRPGEKLGEQVFDENETVSESALPGIFRVAPHSPDAYLTSADVAHIETMARTLDDAIVRQRIFNQLDERLNREERAAG